MQIIVKKFGGTSLADLSRINRAVSYVKKSLALGYKVVVVVSAMGKETDRLLKLTSGLDEYKMILNGEIALNKPEISEIRKFAYFYFIKSCIPWDISEKLYGGFFNGFNIDFASLPFLSIETLLNEPLVFVPMLSSITISSEIKSFTMA